MTTIYYLLICVREGEEVYKCQRPTSRLDENNFYLDGDLVKYSGLRVATIRALSGLNAATNGTTFATKQKAKTGTKKAPLFCMQHPSDFTNTLDQVLLLLS